MSYKVGKNKPPPHPKMRYCPKGHDTWIYGRSKSKRSCYECLREYTRNRREEQVARMAAIKLGRGCERCGYVKCAPALHWHHRDPATKEKRLGPHHSWKRLEAEMEKCELLCANCHIEVHNGV